MLRDYSLRTEGSQLAGIRAHLLSDYLLRDFGSSAGIYCSAEGFRRLVRDSVSIVYQLCVKNCLKLPELPESCLRGGMIYKNF